MAKKYQRTLIIIGICIAIGISFLCFWLGYQNYLEPHLADFSILGIEEQQQNIILKLENSHNAKTYEVMIYNQQGEKIFQATSTTPEIPLKNLNVNYGDILRIEAIAQNKNKTNKKAREIYEYRWNKASFKNNNDRYISTNSGLSLMINGYLPNETYKLKLEYLKEVIYEKEIKTDNIFIPYEKLQGYAGRITAKLYTDQNSLISTYNFYINTPLIGKIKIITPEEQFKTRWNDIKIKFEGGENATDYYLSIFKENTLENRIKLSEITKEYTLSAEYLEEDKNYFFSIEATYLDYHEITKQDGVNIYVGKKEETSPVYVSHNPSFIKQGTKITLQTRSDNAKIYYTLDGSTPTENSILYKEPISINENITLKTYAISQNRYDSAIQEYPFQIQNKQLVVYLSPSNQYLNYGVKSAGFTNEMKEMNKIADVVERKLKENGVRVIRNHPSGNINTWLSESNNIKSDLHLAIHSNASKTNARGIEIYVDKPSSKSLSIATHIYQNLYQIYPGKHLKNTNRGIKYAVGSLGEVNDSFIKCGALIEIAYHDNYEDALWMVENREIIGNNIASSILSYYN